MKLIIAGGRTYQMSLSDWEWLDWLSHEIEVTDVVSGGALGADRGGEIWARKRGINLIQFPAMWEIYGKAAGFKRNQEMADIADALAVFPGGRGTEDMIRRARNKDLPVYYATKVRAV